MTSCAWAEKASFFLDGELPDDEGQAFEEHLATCPWCPQAMEDYVGLELAMRRAMDRRASRWGQPGLLVAVLLALFALAVTGTFLGLSDSAARADNQPSANTPARAPVPAVAGDRPSPSAGGAP